MPATPRYPPPPPSTVPANCGPGTHPDPLNPANCVSDKADVPDEGKTGEGEPQPNTGCNCNDYHSPGTRCWTLCKGGQAPSTAPCPHTGEVKGPDGKCACPPGQVIHNEARGCEPEGGELCDPAAHPFFDQKKGRIDEGNPEAHCYWCDFSTRTWKRGYCAPTAGATGTAGAAGTKTAAPGWGAFPSSDFAKQLEAIIKGDLSSPSRFTPEVMQRLYGTIAQQSAGRVQRGQRDVLAQAARAGRSSRWGSTQAGLRAVQAGAETERGKLTMQADLQKITADYQDRQAALDRAQKFLDSARDNEYRYTLMGEQRRQFDANLALGYANLAQQRQNLLSQLQSQWDMTRAWQGFLALLQGV